MIRKTAVLLAVILLLPVMGWAQLYFPRLVGANEWSTTGYAAVNPAGTTATVTLTLYSSSGNLLSSSLQPIPPGGQFAKLGSELFPGIATSGWVQITSDIPVQSFWLGGDFSSFVDGGPPAVASADQVFPLVAGQTELNIANVSGAPNTVTIRIFDANGADLASPVIQNLSGNSLLQSQASALFPSVDISQARHIRVTGTGPVAATSVIRSFLTTTESAVLNGVNSASTEQALHYPHVVSGPVGDANYTTVLGVTNLSSAAQTVTLTFNPESGGTPVSIQRPVAAGGSLRDTASNIFGFSSGFQDGWVQIDGTAPITGFAAYAETLSGGLAVVPVQSTPESSMLFAHIAGQPVWYTGVALLNSGAVDANVEFYAMTPTGTLIGGAANVATASMTLKAGHKMARLLGQIVPETSAQNGGFVFVRTTNGVPLYGMELFGSLDGKIIANVAASGLPSGTVYTPPSPPVSSSVTSISLTPSSVAIDVGAHQTFTAIARDASGGEIPGVAFNWQSSNSSVATVVDGIATGVAAGQVHITATAGSVMSNEAVLTVTAVTPPPPSGPPSSESLISEALAAGDIDAETALRYRVFAAFGDPRLPSAYQGDDSGVFETDVLDVLSEQFETLSAETQLILGPFLLRPSTIGSWLEPDGAQAQSSPGRTFDSVYDRSTCRGESSGWTTLGQPANAKVRVWYRFAIPGQRDKAMIISNAIESKVWPELIGTQQFKEPLGDATVRGCFGGDDRLDVYLAPNLGVKAFTVTDALGLEILLRQSQVYILVNDRLSDDQLPGTIAHEFMHAIQWSYKMAARQKSYGWLRDAMANWAIDQVFGKAPENQLEQLYADCYTRSTDVSLDDRRKGKCSRWWNVERDYGAYLFFQFLAKTLGPQAVKQALVATTSESTSLEAVNVAISGGFAKQWPAFAKTLWNRDPIDAKPQSFKTWDDLTDMPWLAEEFRNPISADLNGSPEDRTDLPEKIANVAIKYFQFTFSDPNTRSLMFKNTFYPNRKQGQKVNVQALWQTESNQWVEEDWSDYEYIGFCRDGVQQRLKQLVIIVSSAEIDPVRNPAVIAQEKPSFKRNNLGCWGFQGTASRTYKGGSWSSGLITYEANVKFAGGANAQYTETAAGKLRVPWLGPSLASGTVRVTENYVESSCRYTASANLSISGADSFGFIFINYFNEALPAALRSDQELVTGTASRAYNASGGTYRGYTGQSVCPDSSGPYTVEGMMWLLTNLEAKDSPLVPRDREGHLRGTFTEPDTGSDKETFTWDLAPIRE